MAVTILIYLVGLIMWSLNIGLAAAFLPWTLGYLLGMLFGKLLVVMVEDYRDRKRYRNTFRK